MTGRRVLHNSSKVALTLEWIQVRWSQPVLYNLRWIQGKALSLTELNLFVETKEIIDM